MVSFGIRLPSYSGRHLSCQSDEIYCVIFAAVFFFFLFNCSFLPYCWIFLLCWVAQSQTSQHPGMRQNQNGNCCIHWGWGSSYRSPQSKETVVPLPGSSPDGPSGFPQICTHYLGCSWVGWGYEMAAEPAAISILSLPCMHLCDTRCWQW